MRQETISAHYRQGNSQPLVIVSHSRDNALLDVNTFTPFGDRLFLPSACPQARIASADVLAVLPTTVAEQSGVLELQPKAFAQFVELSTKMQRKYEMLFSAWSTKLA